MANNNKNYNKNDKPDSSWVKKDFQKDWIARTNGIDKQCIDYTEKLGEHLSKLSSSQIRNVYGEIKRIQMKGIDKESSAFQLLRPKLAYAAKRSDKSYLAEDFKTALTLAHQTVSESSEDIETRFSNFCDFTEAILAYHKAFGGK